MSSSDRLFQLSEELFQQFPPRETHSQPSAEKLRRDEQEKREEMAHEAATPFLGPYIAVQDRFPGQPDDYTLQEVQRARQQLSGEVVDEARIAQLLKVHGFSPEDVNLTLEDIREAQRSADRLLAYLERGIVSTYSRALENERQFGLGGTHVDDQTLFAQTFNDIPSAQSEFLLYSGLKEKPKDTL